MFDVIVGNPPYQEKKAENKTSKKIWDKFVDRTLDLLNKEAYLCLVHPAGWRNYGGRWKKLANKMLERKFLYLDINDVKAGIATFDVQTRYDWYVLQNKEAGGGTLIKDQNNKVYTYDISNLDFIPSGKFEEIFKLVATEQQDTVEMIYDSSYHSQREWMNKEKTSTFVYPCIINVAKEDKLSLWWSKRKKGHFGEKKVIFGKRGANVLVDAKGEYGLCEDGRAIIDKELALPLIKQAMQSKKFVELMKFCDVGGLKVTYNHRVIALFRKDFWKEFIDDNALYLYYAQQNDVLGTLGFRP